MTISVRDAWAADDADSDNRVVARVRAGDHAAFAAVYDRHAEALFHFALSLVRSRHAAEEIVQETFCHLWQQRARWEVHGTVRSYLYGMIRRRTADAMRSARIEQRMLDGAASDLPPMVSVLPATDHRVVGRELAVAIQRAIDMLPKRAGLAYRLHRQHGLSYAEAAEVMGVSPRTVEVHLARALRTLRRQLAPYWPLG